MYKPNFTFEVPQSLLSIIQRLQRAGHRVVIVGGALRDKLLPDKLLPDNFIDSLCRETSSVRPTDYDLASDARPQDVQKLFPRCLDTGSHYGTVTILQDGNPYQITTFRSDGIYKDGRHPENVRFKSNLLDDLARRDFRINAMAFKPCDTTGLLATGKPIRLQGWLHDPHKAQADLKQGRICAIGLAAQRFEEDALRMLRACRFSAKLGFEIEAQTLGAIEQMQQNLARVSRPRVQQELRRLLCAPFAPRGLGYLQQTQLWQQILPHLPAKALGPFDAVWQLGRREDHWLAPLQLMEKTSEKDSLLRWDTAKVPVLSFVWAMLHLSLLPKAPALQSGRQKLEQLLQGERPNPTHPNSTHPNSTKDALYSAAEQGLNELGFSNREKSGALGLLAHSDLIWGPEFLYLGQNKVYIRAFLALLGQHFALPALYLLGLSSQASGAPEELWLRFRTKLFEVLAQRPAFSIKELAIDGKVLLQECGIAPGPQMGKLLQKLLGHVLSRPQDNKSQILQQLARHFDQDPKP